MYIVSYKQKLCFIHTVKISIKILLFTIDRLLIDMTYFAFKLYEYFQIAYVGRYNIQRLIRAPRMHIIKYRFKDTLFSLDYTVIRLYITIRDARNRRIPRRHDRAISYKRTSLNCTSALNYIIQ